MVLIVAILEVRLNFMSWHIFFSVGRIPGVGPWLGMISKLPFSTATPRKLYNKILTHYFGTANAHSLDSSPLVF